jgi:hypothetical protein
MDRQNVLPTKPQDPRPTPDAAELTPEQQAFAEMLGQVFAKQWCAREAANPLVPISKPGPQGRNGVLP